MLTSRLTLSFASFLLGSGLLRAELTRTEFSRKGEWTIHTCTEQGKFVRSEMTRTYNGKHEVHLRISFDGENFHIDSTADWNGIPDAKSHPAAYRIDRAANEPSWQGKAKVIEEADGMTWLRISKPNEPGALDGVANSQKLIINVGPPGKSVAWNFDLKGSNAACTDLIKSFTEHSEAADGIGRPAEAAAGKADTGQVEHDYARPGDWGIHYFTNLKGKYAAASMIRYFDDGRILRLTMDATHFHLDTTADWKKLANAPKDAVGHPIVTIASDQSPDDDSLKYEGTVINEGGDKWLRLSQSFEEPGGLEDGIRNAKTLRLKFGGDDFWSFDLKGSHAARKKLDECIAKHGK